MFCTHTHALKPSAVTGQPDSVSVLPGQLWNTEANAQHPPVNSVAPPGFSSAAPDDGNGYTWRIDLSQTETFWKQWFEGLSKLFLSIAEPKLLFLTSADSLDSQLETGRMQGRSPAMALSIMPPLRGGYNGVFMLDSNHDHRGWKVIIQSTH